MDNSCSETSAKRNALLKWLLSFNPQMPLDSLQSLLENPLLISILSQIDSDYKTSVPPTFTILQTFLHLSKYMILKLNFKGIVLNHCDSAYSMVCQLLYVCVHCEKKENFIKRILNLESDTQSVLMRIISETSVQYEKHKQLKQVLEKVQELQNENEELKKHIILIENQFKRYQDQIEELKKQIGVVIDQNNTFRKEKSEVLKELNVVQFDDYLVLYKRLASEYEDLDSTFKKLNELYQKQKSDNEQYKKKIIEDSQFIYFLGNQSEQARSKWLTLKSIYANKPSQDIYDFDITAPAPSPLSLKCTNIPLNGNQENQDPRKQKEKQKQKSVQLIQSNVLQPKAQNMRAFEQSQEIFQKVNKYKTIIKQLNVKNNSLESCNQALIKKISDLQCVFTNIRTRYPA